MGRITVKKDRSVNDDRRKLKAALETVGGHLQNLQSEQRATTRELGGVQDTVKSLQDSVNKLEGSVRNLEARSVHKEASLVALGGTFASIDQILTRLSQLTPPDRG